MLGCRAAACRLESSLAMFRGASSRCAADATGRSLDEFDLVVWAYAYRIGDVGGDSDVRLEVVISRMASVLSRDDGRVRNGDGFHMEHCNWWDCGLFARSGNLLGIH